MLRRSLRSALRLGDVPMALQLGAFDSFAMANAAPHSQTQSGGGGFPPDVAIATVALPIKYTGIFDVTATVVCSNNVAESTVRHKIVIQQFTNPAAFFTQGTSASVLFGNDVGTDSSAALRSKFGQILNVDSTGLAASGILYNGLAPNSQRAGAVTLFDTTAIANQPGFAGHWVGTATVAPKTAFAPKTTAALPQFIVASVCLVPTNGGDVITYGGVTIYAQERALP
jgi:hypothetical protein